MESDDVAAEALVPPCSAHDEPLPVKRCHKMKKRCRPPKQIHVGHDVGAPSRAPQMKAQGELACYAAAAYDPPGCRTRHTSKLVVLLKSVSHTEWNARQDAPGGREDIAGLAPLLQAALMAVPEAAWELVNGRMQHRLHLPGEQGMKPASAASVLVAALQQSLASVALPCPMCTKPVGAHLMRSVWFNAVHPGQHLDRHTDIESGSALILLLPTEPGFTGGSLRVVRTPCRNLKESADRSLAAHATRDNECALAKEWDMVVLNGHLHAHEVTPVVTGLRLTLGIDLKKCMDPSPVFGSGLRSNRKRYR